MEGEFFKIEEMYVYSRSGKGNDTEEKRRKKGRGIETEETT